MKLATQDRTDPRLNADYRLIKAVFYYGGPAEYPIHLDERWSAVTPAQVEDQISALCRDLAKCSGNTLAPATFYERAKLSFAEVPPVSDEFWGLISETTKQNILAMKDRFTVHGSGFLLSWAKA
ncbi:hypothetical protein HOT99_gp172 [Caulobacter phage CcrBL10]|uniref:Uncharacterized protein n=1 Tax=Caulobacter phage CcrBL10 TaxID=2283269 RepID=A0A385EBT0_9CAUD|nr:hypothetical protein HOT99_gp172 [Caulobacter phage CcrBL10]AXQ68445.1 hypothetical protein CcrBL10_gp241 [Caulobacter phage CcrBL10]